MKVLQDTGTLATMPLHTATEKVEENDESETKNLTREDTRLPFLLKELLWQNENFVTKVS